MLSGKQREIRERHELFLEVGRTQLLEHGYQSLRIADIAETTGFSKVTVYQRFSSKEELVVNLGERCREKLYAALKRGAQFPGRPRERMLALAEICRYHLRHYSDDMRILGIITAEGLLEKVSEEQRSRMEALDARIFDLVLEIVHDAIACGDLVLPQDSTAQTLSLALWALADGYFSATRGSAPIDKVGTADPMEELMTSGRHLLDGYGWQPLSTECDYKETRERIRREVLSSHASEEVSDGDDGLEGAHE